MAAASVLLLVRGISVGRMENTVAVSPNRYAGLLTKKTVPAAAKAMVAAVHVHYAPSGSTWGELTPARLVLNLSSSTRKDL